jgi:hypothetical protein
MAEVDVRIVNLVAGAIVQAVIDVLAVVNALRAAIPPKTLSDYPSQPQLAARPRPVT